MIRTIYNGIKIMLGRGDSEESDESDQSDVLEEYDEDVEVISDESVEGDVKKKDRDDLFEKEDKRDTSGNDNAVPDISEYHKNVIAPTRINKQPTSLSVGKYETRTIFINQWQDNPNIGFLDDVILDTDVVNDISIHISPRRSDKAVKELEKEVNRSKRIAEEGSSSIIDSMQKRKDYEQTKRTLDVLQETNAKLFDVSFYITIRGEDESELELATDQIIKKLQTSPAFTHPEVLKKQQLKAFQTVSPIAEDKLEYSTEMLGGAIGAMYPFSSSSFIEKDGIDYGIHAGNESPIIVDRFGERETGYNQLTFGKIGSGKSFGTKLELLRTYISQDDVKIIMLDPMDGFRNVNMALNGQEIVVGGKVGINPMKIHYTPEEERDKLTDPYVMAKSKVMDFFEMYFSQRGKELGSINNGRGILERAIDISYRQKEIYQDDPESFKNESPTVRDVRDILYDMQEKPEEYANTSSDKNINKVENAAAELSIGFEQFSEGGEYANLAQNSDIDLRGNDVHYINLKQREDSNKTGLMMHLLLSEVYEAAKEHDGKTIFAIDEAHKLLQDSQSIEFLELVVRHSRHADLGINFITQTIEEFFETKRARKIAQMCSIKKFHRVESGLKESTRKALNMKEIHEDYIRTAQAGSKDQDFSQALVGVGSEGYMPCLVIAGDNEEKIIGFDPSGDEELDDLV